ncbi:MAG: Holliday junction resolvase RuvX [Bacilli bacterium]|nr:Holliday junction resolvase RuvX [Bacilli bacterium]
MPKAIGLDLGTTTLGIAISDSLGIVHGLETFHFQANAYSKAREKVHEIVNEKDIKIIALGYPLNMDGTIGERAKSCLKFRDDLLKEDDSLTIEMVDERLTTVMAHRSLSDMNVNHEKRKQVVDTLAASEILETFVRSKGW